jgi:PAS domain S-box-containing protein
VAGLRAYPLLAVVVFVVALAELVRELAQQPALPPYGAAMLAGFGIVLFVADLLRRAGRPMLGAAFVAVTLIVVAFFGGLLYPRQAASGFAPLLAFAFLLPHITGRQAAAWAVMASIAAWPLVLLPFGHEAVADPGAFTNLGMAASGATGVVTLILLRLRREADGLRRRYQAMVEDLPIGVFRAGLDGHLVDVNETLVRLLGYPDREALLAAHVTDLFVDIAGRSAAPQPPGAGETEVQEAILRRLDGSLFWARQRMRRVDIDEDTPGFEGVVEDISDERASREMADRMATLVESAQDPIIGQSIDGLVTTWNAAAERTYGWMAEEIVGQPSSRIVPPSREAERSNLLTRVHSGERVQSLETERVAKDGRVVAVLLSMWPITDGDGRITGTASIARDVTEQRRLEAQLARWTRERAMILEALGRLTPGDTAEATASAICSELATTGGFAHAGIISFEADGSLTVLAAWAQGRPFEVGPLRADQNLLFRKQASAGPWIQHINVSPETATRRHLEHTGVRDLAYVPIEYRGELVALLAAGTGTLQPAELADRLPALEEFAALAAPILGPALAGRSREIASRARIEAAIGSGGFRPVFQPIVELASRELRGREALTRFADGTPPQQFFAEAARVGLGLELEEATLGAALSASAGFAPGPFLDLNVSPALILAIEPLRSIVAQWGSEVILEITEHERIEDYTALRAALAEIGPHVRLAVDDAGAGFASLKHIIELRPAFVKVDRSLVAGIDQDSARQGVVAGMQHLARSIDCQLVAEGVETEAERAALIGLGVTMGQGYLFAHPEPAS